MMQEHKWTFQVMVSLIEKLMRALVHSHRNAIQTCTPKTPRLFLSTFKSPHLCKNSQCNDAVMMHCQVASAVVGRGSTYRL